MLMRGRAGLDAGAAMVGTVVGIDNVAASKEWGQVGEYRPQAREPAASGGRCRRADPLPPPTAVRVAQAYVSCKCSKPQALRPPCPRLPTLPAQFCVSMTSASARRHLDPEARHQCSVDPHVGPSA